MTEQKSVNVPAGSFPHAVLIPEGQYAHLPPIAVGRALTLIGSEDTVHVRLRSRTISPVHAMLLNADGRVILRDLASHSHVYVNSRLVREAILAAGDKIRVGRIHFVFQPGEMAGDKITQELAPAQLCNQNGKIASIKSAIFVIGRRRDTDLVVQNTPEPAHAVIFSINGRRFLRHLKLSAPVNLNDQEIRQSALDQGDVIDIYGEKYQFTLTPAMSEQPSESSEALELSTVQPAAAALIEASVGEPQFDSQDSPAQPEFDAGISPSLSALQTHSETPAAIEAAQAEQAAPSGGDLAIAAAAVVAETESVDASVRSANELVIGITTPSVSERISEAKESLLSRNSKSSRPVRRESPRLIPRPAASLAPDDLPVNAPKPGDEKLADSFASDSVAPVIAENAPVVEDLPPKFEDPEHAPFGLDFTDEMLPSLKEWGPLAMAMLAEQRQDLLAEPPVIAEEPRPNQKWAWISMVAAITLALGFGAWLITLKRPL